MHINTLVPTLLLGTSILFTACFDNDKKEEVKSELIQLKFSQVFVPTEAVTQNSLQHINSATINGKKVALKYTPLMRTGYADNGEIFGAIKDKEGKLITFADGSAYICNGTNEGVGSGLDFTSILEKDDKLYMVSQFECSIGAMYMAELEQSKEGILTPKKGTLKYIDQNSEFGGWTHCAGSVTPWQSHLGSEEYESDARSVESSGGDTYYKELEKYWGDEYASITPYYYGWITETKISKDKAHYSKHYSMGRFSHELAYVMPDKKTAYLSDDGQNVGLYMFVADSKENLEAGTLYGAKFHQTKNTMGGAFDLDWISLGHASDVEIRKMLIEKPQFSDIFESAVATSGAQCPDSFISINTSVGQECLKVKKGKELMASRLETRRYASMMGVSTEIRKEEGITYDSNRHRLYIALSKVTRGMEKNHTQYDLGGHDDIQLPANACGGIYALDLEKSKKMDTDYSAKNFYALISGEPKEYKGTKYEGNLCNIDGLSNPDNITYIPNTNMLMIAEDTTSHINNMLWALDISTNELTRIATTPKGAEASGIFWYQNINDFSYLSFTTQHPSETKESTVGLFSIKGF